MREKHPAAPPSDGSPAGGRRRWFSIMPLLVFLVVVGEIALLGRLDVAKNAAMVNSWAHSFYPSPSSSVLVKIGEGEVVVEEEEEEWVAAGGCEEWLEKADALNYTRDFGKDPVFVYGGEQEDWKSCSVGCKFGYVAAPNRKPDASFSLMSDQKIASIHRSMESAHYYPENNLAQARRRGFTVVMTTSLSSDVPVGYFSWAEYDIMAPVMPKTEKALAAAFISNCGARNFRLEALVELEKLNIKIDSYGGCHRNRDERVDKVQALKRYKFSLAFENSNEEDYVTEKFFQSLVAGTIPVVVGAPNILDFAPFPDSVLHIKELTDVATVAKRMKYLAAIPKAYNDSLSWKYKGPSDSFKALVDMAAVHSSCRLCIFLATKIREHEERSNYEFQNRPCKCTRDSETVYHIFVRERGRFEFESIFLRSGDLTLEALESAITRKFKSLDHKPIWKEERPQMLRGTNQLKIYRIYPVGMTQRQALFVFKFGGDEDFRQHIKQNPCAKFEVIFV